MQELFVLNQNLTDAAFSKNREYDILDASAVDVKEARDIFIADWNRTSAPMSDSHLVVSPLNSMSVLEGLVTNATKSLEIEIEDINDPGIVNLLLTKAKRIPIKLIVPSFKQISSNRDSVLSLKSGGVLVKVLTSPYLHAKLILVDDKRAYTGSINLSTQSMDKNREIGIILSNPEILRSLSDSFTSDWALGSETIQ